MAPATKMSSEDGKAMLNKEETEQEQDSKSLNSMVDARKKNYSAKMVKHVSNDDDGAKKPVRTHATSKGGKPKKDEVEDDDDEDNKPLSQKTSIAKSNKELKRKKVNEDEEAQASVKVEKRKVSVNGEDKEKVSVKIEKKKVSVNRDHEEKVLVKVEKKKVTVKGVNDKKRVKKIYDLPGQKRDPPPERDPLRIFYESLHRQIPKSQMALFWMMECGLLSKEDAKRAYEMKQKAGQQNKLKSPAKTVACVKKTATSATVKKRASPVVDSSDKKKKADGGSVGKQTKKSKAEDESSENSSDDDFVASLLKKKGKHNA